MFQEMLRLSVARFKTIAWCSFGAGLFTFMLCLILPKTYEVKSTIVPMDQSDSALSSQLATLNYLPPALGATAGRETSMILLTVMRSSAVLWRVLKTCDSAAAKLYGSHEEDIMARTSLMRLAENLRENVTISKDRGSTIEVLTRAKGDPELALCYNRSLLEETDHFFQNSSVGNARLKRQFVEAQLNTAQEKLFQTQELMTSFNATAGTIVVDRDFLSILDSLTSDYLRASAASLEIGVFSRLTRSAASSAASTSLDWQELVNQKLSSLKSDRKRSLVVTSFQKVPLLAMEYTRLAQDQRMLEALVTSLKQQQSRLQTEELDETKKFEVLDPPFSNLRPVFPRPLMMALIAAFVVGLLMVVFLSRSSGSVAN